MKMTSPQARGFYSFSSYWLILFYSETSSKTFGKNSFTVQVQKYRNSPLMLSQFFPWINSFGPWTRSCFLYICVTLWCWCVFTKVGQPERVSGTKFSRKEKKKKSINQSIRVLSKQTTRLPRSSSQQPSHAAAKRQTEQTLICRSVPVKQAFIKAHWDYFHNSSAGYFLN